ncbi:MAG: TIM barrel protein, partial [Candidatus Omnitrophota bacterium]
MFSKVKQKLIRATSLLTLACFLSSQVTFADPGAGIAMMAVRETPGFLQIDIPDELATLDGLYEAPPHADPKFILHIQNAHANYGAQQKIKQLLQYLDKSYGIKTLFVEGASEDLNPDYLKMFPDKERNLKLAQFLAEQGELTGAELYLLEADKDYRPQTTDSSKKDFSLQSPVSSLQSDGSAVRAHGIENAELYRENYEALKKVFGSEATVKKYLDGFEGRLSGLASKVFPGDLIKLLGEWKKFEKGHREFMPYIRNLTAEAKRVLGIDLESLLAQVEWPQTTRLLVLQAMEKELDTAKGLSERDTLIKFLKEKKVSPKLVTAIENFKDQRLSVMRTGVAGQAGPIEPRDLMEQLVMEAGPKGFRFSDYPHFSLYAGYLILKSELDPKSLFTEIRSLFTRILDKLAATEQQKALLALYRDEELVRKLLNLELTRKDWQEVLGREEVLSMEAMVGELKKIGILVSQQLNLPLSNFETKPVNPNFKKAVTEVQEAAYRFYEAARKREDVFYEKIDTVMRRESLSKAVVITGGFHTDGITELLREHEISYGVLTPRLSEKSDENLYRSVMLQNKASTFELSYLEAVSRLESFRAQGEQLGGQDVLRNLMPVLRAIGRAGDYGTVDGAIGIFNQSDYAKNAGIQIALTPIGEKNSRKIYRVIRLQEAEALEAIGKVGATTDQITDVLTDLAGSPAPAGQVSPILAQGLAVQGELIKQKTDKGEIKPIGADAARDQIAPIVNQVATNLGQEPSAVAAAMLADMNKLAAKTPITGPVSQTNNLPTSAAPNSSAGGRITTTLGVPSTETPARTVGKRSESRLATLESDIAELENEVRRIGVNELPVMGFHGQPPWPVKSYFYFVFRGKKASGLDSDLAMPVEEFLKRLQGTVISTSNYSSFDLSKGVKPVIHLLTDTDGFRLFGTNEKSSTNTFDVLDPYVVDPNLKRVRRYPYFPWEGVENPQKVPDQAKREITLSDEELKEIQAEGKRIAKPEIGLGAAQAMSFLAYRVLYEKALSEMISQAQQARSVPSTPGTGMDPAATPALKRSEARTALDIASEKEADIRRRFEAGDSLGRAEAFKIITQDEFEDHLYRLSEDKKTWVRSEEEALRFRNGQKVSSEAARNQQLARELLNASHELTADRQRAKRAEAYRNAGYELIDGFWVDPLMPYSRIRGLSETVKNVLRSLGVKDIRFVRDQRAAGLVSGMRLGDGGPYLDNDTMALASVDDFAFDPGAFEHIVLHEAGHHVWQKKLSEEQRETWSARERVTAHGQNIASGKETGDGWYSPEMAPEEDFAESFAVAKGIVDESGFPVQKKVRSEKRGEPAAQVSPATPSEVTTQPSAVPATTPADGRSEVRDKELLEKFEPVDASISLPVLAGVSPAARKFFDRQEAVEKWINRYWGGVVAACAISGGAVASFLIAEFLARTDLFSNWENVVLWGVSLFVGAISGLAGLLWSAFRSQKYPLDYLDANDRISHPKSEQNIRTLESLVPGAKDLRAAYDAMVIDVGTRHRNGTLPKGVSVLLTIIPDQMEFALEDSRETALASATAEILFDHSHIVIAIKGQSEESFPVVLRNGDHSSVKALVDQGGRTVERNIEELILEKTGVRLRGSFEEALESLETSSHAVTLGKTGETLMLRNRREDVQLVINQQGEFLESAVLAQRLPKVFARYGNYLFSYHSHPEDEGGINPGDIAAIESSSKAFGRPIPEVIWSPLSRTQLAGRVYVPVQKTRPGKDGPEVYFEVNEVPDAILLVTLPDAVTAEPKFNADPKRSEVRGDQAVRDAEAMIAGLRVRGPDGTPRTYKLQEGTMKAVVGALDRLGEAGAETLGKPYCLFKLATTYESLKAASKPEELAGKFQSRVTEYVAGNVPGAQRLDRKEGTKTIEAGASAFFNLEGDILSAIREAYNRGLTHVEVSFDNLPYAAGFAPGSVSARRLPGEYSPEYKDAIKDLLEKTGIKLTVHSSIVGPAVGAQFLFEDAADNPEFMKEQIRFAGEIGAAGIVVHLMTLSPEAKKAYAELVLYASQAAPDLKINLENYHDKTPGKKNYTKSAGFMDAFEDIFELVKEQDPGALKNLGIVLDVAHYNLSGEDPVVSADTIAQRVKALARKYPEHRETVIGYLRELHLNENLGPIEDYVGFSADLHSPVSTPGPIDIEGVITVLASHGLDPLALVEQERDLSPEDIDFMGKVLEHAQDIRREVEAAGGDYEAAVEIYRQKGEVILNEPGVAKYGLLFRDTKVRAGYALMAGLMGKEKSAAFSDHMQRRVYQKLLSLRSEKEFRELEDAGLTELFQLTVLASGKPFPPQGEKMDPTLKSGKPSVAYLVVKERNSVFVTDPVTFKIWNALSIFTEKFSGESSFDTLILKLPILKMEELMPHLGNHFEGLNTRNEKDIAAAAKADTVAAAEKAKAAKRSEMRGWKDLKKSLTVLLITVMLALSGGGGQVNATEPLATLSPESLAQVQANSLSAKVMSTPLFGTAAERQSFAGDGKAVKLGEPVDLAWLKLAGGDFTVEFVPREKLEPAKDFYKPASMEGEGRDAVYHYALPEDLTVSEALKLIGVLQKLPHSSNPNVFLSQVAETFKSTAVLMAQLAMTQALTAEQAAMINGFYGIGTSLLTTVQTDVLPTLEEIRAMPLQEEMDRQVFKALGLYNQERYKFKQYFGESASSVAISELGLWDRALRLAVNQVRSEFEAVAYFQGLMRYKEYFDGEHLKGVDIPALKKAIEDARKKGAEKASEVELNAIKKIVEVLVKLPGWVYKDTEEATIVVEASPSWMALTNRLNCLGRVAIGGEEMEQIGIKLWSVLPEFYAGSIEKANHILLLVQLSDGRFIWVEPSRPKAYSILNAHLGIKEIPEIGIRLINLRDSSGVDSARILPFKPTIKESFRHNFDAVLKGTKIIEEMRSEKPPDPVSAKFYFDQGGRYARVDKFGEAIDAYRQAIALDPKLLIARSRLVDALIATEKYEDAIPEIDKLIALDPGGLRQFRVLGGILKNSGNLEGALAQFQKVLSLAHDYPGLSGEVRAAWISIKEIQEELKIAEDPSLWPNLQKPESSIETTQGESQNRSEMRGDGVISAAADVAKTNPVLSRRSFLKLLGAAAGVAVLDGPASWAATLEVPTRFATTLVQQGGVLENAIVQDVMTLPLKDVLSRFGISFDSDTKDILSWFNLTGGVELKFVKNPPQNYLKPSVTGKGEGAVYHFQLPENLSLQEALNLLKVIQGLPNGVREGVLLPKVAKQLIGMADHMTQLAKSRGGEISPEQQSLISAFSGVGAMLAGSAVDALGNGVEQTLRQGMNEEFYSRLGLSGEERQLFEEIFGRKGDAEKSIRALDLPRKLTDLVIQTILVELEYATYFKGVKDTQKLLADYLGWKINVPGLKKSIAEAKQKYGDDSPQVVQAELDAIRKILDPILALPGWVDTSKPERGALEAAPGPVWRSGGEMSCVFRSIFAGKYLEDLGIQNWVASYPGDRLFIGHAFNVVELSDGTYRWIDPSSENRDASIVSSDERRPKLERGEIPPEGVVLDTRKAIRVIPFQEAIQLFLWNYAVVTGIVFPKDLARMEMLYRQQIALNPKNHDAYINLGDKLMTVPSRLDDAIKLYEAAIRLNPGYAEDEMSPAVFTDYMGLGDAYLLKGKYGKTLGSYPTAHVSYAKSRASYEKASQLKPWAPMPYFRLGNLLNSAGEIREALAQFEKFIEAAETNYLLDKYVEYAKAKVAELKDKLSETPSEQAPRSEVPEKRSEVRGMSISRIVATGMLTLFLSLSVLFTGDLRAGMVQQVSTPVVAPVAASAGTIPLYLGFVMHDGVENLNREVISLINEAVMKAPRLANGKPNALAILETGWADYLNKLLGDLQGGRVSFLSGKVPEKDDLARVGRLLDLYRGDPEIRARIDEEAHKFYASRKGFQTYGVNDPKKLIRETQGRGPAATFRGAELKALAAANVPGVVFEAPDFESSLCYWLSHLFYGQFFEALGEGSLDKAMSAFEQFTRWGDERMKIRDEALAGQIRSLTAEDPSRPVIHLRGMDHSGNREIIADGTMPRGIYEPKGMLWERYVASMDPSAPKSLQQTYAELFLVGLGFYEAGLKDPADTRAMDLARAMETTLNGLSESEARNAMQDAVRKIADTVKKDRSSASPRAKFQDAALKVFSASSSARSQQVQFDFPQLWEAVQSQGLLKGVTEKDLRDSISFSEKETAVVKGAIDLLVEKQILPEEAYRVKVVFLSGIDPEKYKAMRSGPKSFAMAFIGLNTVIVDQGAYQEIPSGERAKWLAIKIAHEIMHILLGENVPVLIQEAITYRVTLEVMKALGNESPEQIEAQERVAKAFEALSKNPGGVVTKAFDLLPEDLGLLNYDQIVPAGTEMTLVRIYDMNQPDGKKIMFGVDGEGNVIRDPQLLTGEA